MRSLVVVVAIAGLTGGATASPDVKQRGLGFAISVDRPELRPSESGMLEIELRAADGRKLDEDYPIKIAITASPGIAVARTALGNGDALSRDATGASFGLGIVGRTAGEHHLDLDVRFAVCSPSTCELQHRIVSVPVRVR